MVLVPANSDIYNSETVIMPPKVSFIEVMVSCHRMLLFTVVKLLSWLSFPVIELLDVPPNGVINSGGAVYHASQ